MPGIRDEITKTIRRLNARASQNRKQPPSALDETLIASDPRVGRHYGTYRILHRLGTGGMGHVYLAQDMRLGRHAALKFLSPKLKSNPEMLARLQQEARTASSLNHPNILTIYDIDEAEGEPFIASEFVDGVTLRYVLERGPIQPAAALDIAIQIASALKPAHDAGIVHRDLKPGNIMLRPDGFVKVIDFGLAKLTAQGHFDPLYEPLSDPGSVAGTVQYMSPEQARGDEVDHRSDLWSLGVMLYEMVSHCKPFDGETESHIIVAILDHRPAELKVAAGLPSGLARIVEKSLAKSPDKRFHNAQEMLSALKALEVSSQSRPSIVGQSKAIALAITPRRRPRPAFAAALVTLTLAALAAWWWPFHGREILLGPDWFEPHNFTQVTHRGDVTLASISPDGKSIAFITRKYAQDQLHLLHLDTGREFLWPPYSGDTMGLTVSPDSSAVYITVHDQREWGRLYRAKDDSTDLTFVMDDIDGPIAFSPDGKRFAFRRRFDEKRTNREAVVIARTNDTGDQQTVLSKFNTRVGPRIDWSADGVLAVNLEKDDLSGNFIQTVLFFSPNGNELEQHQDTRLRRLSGPAWLNSRSMLIFSGYGRGSNESVVIELARRTGQFRIFASPVLASQSLTASADHRRIAAVASERKSALWVADATNIDSPERWSDGDSFDSFAWTSTNSIVHPSMRGGTLALWEIVRGGVTHALPHGSDCMSTQPASVPGTEILVFSSNCDAGASESNLWLLNRADATFTKLTEHSHTDNRAAVSSDSDTLVYNSWPNNSPALMKLSLHSRVKSQFTNFQARNPAISPDGQHVACQIRESYDGQWRVAILSMRDATIEKDNLPLPTEINSVIRWNPDGAALDYVNTNDPANVWRLPLAGSVAEPLTHLHGPPIDDFAWNIGGTQLAWVCSDVRQDVIIFLSSKEHLDGRRQR